MDFINDSIMLPYLDAYQKYLKNQNKQENTRSFENCEEDYKREIAKTASKILNVKSWNEMQIGSGVIGEAVIKAVQRNLNLVNRNQVTLFLNIVKEDYSISERVLFDLYHEHKEEECFARICELFGEKYDLIAYLFFIYDPVMYLPIRSNIFDGIFKKMGIEYQTAYRCSWENYQGYISTVSHVRDRMKEYYQNDDIDLLDAHSFLWTTQFLSIGVIEVGARVVHKQYYGEGIITKISDENIFVRFDNYMGERIFPKDSFEYPKEYLELI